ncbi:MAG: transcription-repair coupling factor [bacterium]
MKSIVDLLIQSSYFKNRQNFSGLVGSAKSVVLSLIAKEEKKLLVITSTVANAEKIRQEISLLSGLDPAIFPYLDEEIAPSKELIGQRLEILSGWQEKRDQIVIAPLKAMLSKSSKKSVSLLVGEGEGLRIDDLVGKLVSYDYKRFDIVGERGEFSVRGGIVDIFPVNAPAPIRLEFADNLVESVRQFDPYSQRSTQKIKEYAIVPAAEKGEAAVSELLPKELTIILDEPVELERTEGFAKIKSLGKIILSSFLTSGEEPFFTSPPSYLGKIEEIPKKAIIVSRHAPRLKEELPDVQIIQGELDGGFIFNNQEIITDRELFGEGSRRIGSRGKVKEGVAEELLADLKVGDYVVHENYGIGIYQGTQTLDIDGISQEYLYLQFAGEDKLYVPPTMAGMVEKYSGAGEGTPRLSKMGTGEWRKTRSRVKKELKDMTRELLEIYSSRQKYEGFAFPPDDLWQKELEATFPYDETPDQLKAINSVKKDMEAGHPMDRLVCGDVGYGKTEVAIRAAAKAASAGKQVAILAPTTILVEQHYNNFKERFKNLPFTIEMLSRFRSAKEQKEVVKGLEIGGVDIVIGTHRLLSKDIKFKDIGLLIVDEEQKFGVGHKEKLKRWRKTVDVLTLTATPIPRTLYFSLSGIREFSLISTPPVDRSPIRTYVIPFNEKVIGEAIAREIDRGGQVYFVHNFVDSITGIAARIKKLVPGARVAVGHGQMDEKTLEKTMLGFMAKEYDVLVCTSIIESGLDITNVNTILIDHSDRLGLSQLYQIRGRVGRSAARAYAYLFYHPARSLSDQALARLKAIQEFTVLGSGYKLAMRDLEIRGAGNLLGAEQSGHIYEVGFDLYCQLLDEAVKELKGEKVTPIREVEVDIKVAASIPSDYVTDDRQRIALYRRLNLVTTEAGIKELGQEMVDRFGKLPPEVVTLLRIVGLKVRSLESGVRSIREKDHQIRIEYQSKRVKTLNLPGKKFLDNFRVADFD